MSKIVLQGMTFTSYIGVHDFEQQHGNRFEVDLEIHSIHIVAKEDTLAHTIDYAMVYTLVASVMQGRYQLIETAAADILRSLRCANIPAERFIVRVAKLEPPVGGPVQKVLVEMAG